MALSMSIQKEQIPKVCDLCETEIKIKWKCFNCNLLMCSKCKDKIHSKIKYADEHKVIDIKDTGLHSENVDFSYIKCQDHAGQTCFMFCKSFDQ